jgi:transposase
MYGKNVLFTDLGSWKTEDIAKTYNSKSIVEDDFKVLKNRLLIPMKPFFHRYDSHLRVHIFICILSMVLYRYMLWKLKDLRLSEQEVTKEMRDMRLAFLKQEGSSSVKAVLEKMTPEQIRIYTALNLDKYLPN